MTAQGTSIPVEVVFNPNSWFGNYGLSRSTKPFTSIAINIWLMMSRCAEPCANVLESGRRTRNRIPSRGCNPTMGTALRRSRFGEAEEGELI